MQQRRRRDETGGPGIDMIGVRQNGKAKMMEIEST